MKIANISNHKLTEEQVEGLQKDFGACFKDGVEIIELPEQFKEDWANLDPEDFSEVVLLIQDWMKDNGIKWAHVAGFAPAVIQMVVSRKFICLYSFSRRVSQEKEINGEIVKTSVFKHVGWFQY